MADVNGGGEPGRDRGQMLLVAAFGVAVMLVVLALVLNTAIYTENIATRGSDISGGKDAVRYQASTQQAVGGTIDYVNYHNNSTADSDGDYAVLREPVRWGVWNYSNMSGRQQAADSIVTNVSLQRQSKGTRVYQNRDGNFSSESDDRNWTVVEDTRGVRNLTIDATDELEQYDPADNSPVKSSPLFFVNFTDDPSGEWYRIYLFEDADDPDVAVVQVATKSGGFVGQCTAEYGSDRRVTLEVTAGIFDGEPCSPLHVVGNAYTDAFDVRFNDSTDGSDNDLITGRYSLVTNRSYANVGTVSATGPLPDKTRASYSATVHVVYESKRLYFETDLRVAPGEPDV